MMQKQAIRLISKVGKNKWKVPHSAGTVTFHKTEQAAQEDKQYVYKTNTVVVFDPFVGIYSY